MLSFPQRQVLILVRILKCSLPPRAIFTNTKEAARRSWLTYGHLHNIARKEAHRRPRYKCMTSGSSPFFSIHIGIWFCGNPVVIEGGAAVDVPKKSPTCTVVTDRLYMLYLAPVCHKSSYFVIFRNMSTQRGGLRTHMMNSEGPNNVLFIPGH